jgi:hypothetical protein
MVVGKKKNASPTWIEVKAVLQTFDRTGLIGLAQDLYAASKANQALLHARLGFGHNQLAPYKASISRWIRPDLERNQSVSVSNAKRAIAAYKKAFGRVEGLAELSIFYCEEAFDFLEICAQEDEKYFAALIRMYGRCLNFVSSLQPGERRSYLERLNNLRSRASHVGWGVEEELNSLWHAADLLDPP